MRVVFYISEETLSLLLLGPQADSLGRTAKQRGYILSLRPFLEIVQESLARSVRVLRLDVGIDAHTLQKRL